MESAIFEVVDIDVVGGGGLSSKRLVAQPRARKWTLTRRTRLLSIVSLRAERFTILVSQMAHHFQYIDSGRWSNEFEAVM